MKKILTLILISVMLMSSAMTNVFADDTTPTGTITISNAEIGWTYHIVKVFDAQVHNNSGQDAVPDVSYKLKKSDNTELFSLINKNANASVASTIIDNPFVLTKIGSEAETDSTEYQVTHKTPTQGQSGEFGRGWLYALYDKDGGWHATPVDDKTLSGTQINNLVSKQLPYGYYMIYKTKGSEKASVASVVNLISSNATIYDKNPRVPSDPEKKIIAINNISTDTNEVQVGDIVKYQASFMATNYRTYEDISTSKIIDSYIVRDVSKGLKYKALNSLRIYKTKTDNGFDNLVREETWTSTQTPPYHQVDPTFGGYYMNIPWVDANGQSLYPSPCYVVLEYEMYVTELISNNLYNNTATNTFSPFYVIDGHETPIDNPPSVEVHTTGLSLSKVNEYGEPLTGSKFILSKIEGEGTSLTEKYYTINTHTSDVTLETWKDVEWDTNKANALSVTVTNNPEAQTFYGLSSGTYRLYEVNTPQGYQLPSFEYWKIVISYDKNQEVFSAKIYQGPNDTTGKDLSLATYKKGTGTSNRYYFLASIVNTGGKVLPQTGAAGTTWLLIGGGTLFVATMLVLVTKKRLYNQG